MFRSAGEAVSRRRWVLMSALLVSPTFVLLLFFFTVFPACFSLIFGGMRSQRTSTRRRVLRFFGVVFLATLSLRLVSDSVMRREGSLTTALFRFTASIPVEFTSGCRRSSHDVDSVQAIKPPMELNFQPTSSLFPFLGRPEPNISPWFAPFQSYNTRSTSFTRVDPNFIGSSSLSPLLKVKPFSPACILSSDCTVHLRRSLSGVFSSDTGVQSRSVAFLSSSTAKCELSVQFDWAWPICVTKSGSSSLNVLEPISIEIMIRSLLIFDGWVIVYEISSFSRCILPYFSYGMILQQSFVLSPSMTAPSKPELPLSPAALSPTAPPKIHLERK
ncbi:unnamed protein product [Eruca vesicaria subsp. sativa]|uniref:Transmembrane protein n=1 Tax=Eruca vesicaria subsp. sativa TaxID=29727 RepID=A0ABC8IR28_ERUVS|nr:unnamed protein product [Eruca vesicaria subsp. sativa]